MSTSATRGPITIGLFGPPDDQEVAALAERLRHRGAEPWIVDPGALPGEGPHEGRADARASAGHEYRATGEIRVARVRSDGHRLLLPPGRHAGAAAQRGRGGRAARSRAAVTPQLFHIIYIT